MKALVYKGPRDIQVKEVLDAKIERPTDVAHYQSVTAMSWMPL